MRTSLTINGVGVDVFKLHQQIKTLPELKFRDMSLVFPGSE